MFMWFLKTLLQVRKHANKWLTVFSPQVQTLGTHNILVFEFWMCSIITCRLFLFKVLETSKCNSNVHLTGQDPFWFIFVIEQNWKDISKWKTVRTIYVCYLLKSSLIHMPNTRLWLKGILSEILLFIKSKYNWQCLFCYSWTIMFYNRKPLMPPPFPLAEIKPLPLVKSTFRCNWKNTSNSPPFHRIWFSSMIFS